MFTLLEAGVEISASGLDEIHRQLDELEARASGLTRAEIEAELNTDSLDLSAVESALESDMDKLQRFLMLDLDTSQIEQDIRTINGALEAGLDGDLGDLARQQIDGLTTDLERLRAEAELLETDLRSSESLGDIDPRQIADDFRELADSGADAADNLSNIVSSDADDFLLRLGFFGDDARVSMRQLTSQLPQLGRQLGLINNQSGSTAAGLGALGSSSRGLISQLAKAGPVVGTVAAVIGGLGLTAFAQDSERASRSFSAFGALFTDPLRDGINDIGNEVNNFFEFLASVSGADIDFGSADADAFAEEIRDQIEAFKEADPFIRKYNEQLADLNEQLQAAQRENRQDRIVDLTEDIEQLQELRQEYDREKDASEQLSDSLARQAEVRQSLFGGGNDFAKQLRDARAVFDASDDLTFDDLENAYQTIISGTIQSTNEVDELNEQLQQLRDLQTAINNEELGIETDTTRLDDAIRLAEFDLEQALTLPQSQFAAEIVFENDPTIELQRQIDRINFGITSGEFGEFTAAAKQEITELQEQIEDIKFEPFESLTNRSAIRDIDDQIAALKRLQDEFSPERFAFELERLTEQRANLVDPFREEAELLAESVRTPFQIAEDEIDRIVRLGKLTEIDVTVQDAAIEQVIDRLAEANNLRDRLQVLDSGAAIESTSLAAGQLQTEILNSVQLEAAQLNLDEGFADMAAELRNRSTRQDDQQANSKLVDAVNRLEAKLGESQDVDVRVRPPRVFNIPLNF